MIPKIMIPAMNDFQLDILEGMANTKMKSYLMPRSLENDIDKEKIDLDNIHIEFLMDWGLLMLASEDGKSGRTLRIFRITPRGQAMFGRTRWGRRKN
jgi:hypothetical protein